MKPLSVLALALCPCFLFAQQSAPPQPGQLADSSSTESTPKEAKRLFGIIPNYRTSPSLRDFQPLSPREKFGIASQDAFDRGTFILSAVFAAQGQLSNSNRSFGQGAAGYGQYLAAAYGDYMIGDFMTEGVFPTLLHQDPRYFRKGTGSGLSRLGYSMGQIFVTHSDYEAKNMVNYSELLGNATAVAISNAYYKDNRDVSDAVSKWGTQIGVDMASNVLKEFFPDISRKFSRKHHQSVTN